MTEERKTGHNTRLVLFGHSASAFANAVEKFFIFSLQMLSNIVSLNQLFGRHSFKPQTKQAAKTLAVSLKDDTTQRQ